ncbi:hypothetical protein [Bradyrhizobium liaoningense]|uniref:hypothetical protein n=1 Tax=Bradyrhizobium liaoningense TaxID=43992 RepID=UPI001BA47300|nr:hypothetical protein [Bradyrhizobium liaoningense]MBR0717190.1 hypothetical protein [Bradyrhizobium liaoningense]
MDGPKRVNFVPGGRAVDQWPPDFPGEGKMIMKLRKLVCLMALFFSPGAFASELVGQYYVPFLDLGKGQFQPETLTIVKPNGTFETHTVHKGLREVRQGAFQDSGGQARISALRDVVKCAGVLNEDESDGVTFTYKKTATELVMFIGQEKQSIAVATPDQVAKVMSVPPCK